MSKIEDEVEAALARKSVEVPTPEKTTPEKTVHVDAGDAVEIFYKDHTNAGCYYPGTVERVYDVLVRHKRR